MAAVTPALYTWNFGGDRGQKLRELCRQLQITLCPVEAGQVHLPLARLTRAGQAPGPAAMPFREEMLLMAGFREGLLDAFLAGLRESGLAPVPLKAVLTPYNALWDSVRLHNELIRESQSLPGR